MKPKNNRKDNYRPRFVELTPEQLKLKCAAIRASWSPATRKKREAHPAVQWKLPTVKEVH